MSIDLTIVEEKYKIKIGAEVFSVDYPSFEEAQAISKEFNKIKDGDLVISSMKKWLIDLGLSENFFSLKVIKAKHIIKIWEDINSVKK